MTHKPVISQEIRDGLQRWKNFNGNGASANTIFEFFMGMHVNRPNYPHDSGDFGRCLALLHFAPELHDRIGEMSAIAGYHGEIWGELGKNWYDLLSRFEYPSTCTLRINDIIEPIEKASGRVVKFAGASLHLPTGMPSPSSKPKKEKPMSEKKAGAGHNSKLPSSVPSSVAGVSGERLMNFLDRIERMEEEKAGLADDIRDVYAEAKSAGYETKIMRQLVRLRKMDRQKRQEQEELLELYKSAIGLE